MAALSRRLPACRNCRGGRFRGFGVACLPMGPWRPWERRLGAVVGVGAERLPLLGKTTPDATIAP